MVLTLKKVFFSCKVNNSNAQLAWILDCCTQFSELSRMTQFKDRTEKHADNINCGLFSYPILMAADILLYNTDIVPIGLDQKQHLELTRTIAERFNFLYTDIFKIPKNYISKKGSKIMSLQSPIKKMSKSDKNFDSWIALLDSPADIIRKFKRAVTDSESCVRYDDINKPGISNLMTIYSCMSGKNFKDIEKEFDGIGYGNFKEAVGECVIEKLLPIQSKFFELIKDREYLEKCYKAGAEKARCIANKTLDKVKKEIGFIVQ